MSETKLEAKLAQHLDNQPTTIASAEDPFSVGHGDADPMATSLMCRQYLSALNPLCVQLEQTLSGQAPKLPEEPRHEKAHKTLRKAIKDQFTVGHLKLSHPMKLETSYDLYTEAPIAPFHMDYLELRYPVNFGRPNNLYIENPITVDRLKLSSSVKPKTPYDLYADPPKFRMGSIKLNGAMNFGTPYDLYLEEMRSMRFPEKEHEIPPDNTLMIHGINLGLRSLFSEEPLSEPSPPSDKQEPLSLSCIAHYYLMPIMSMVLSVNKDDPCE